MGLHLIKSFCMSKETVNRVKRQSMEWKKIIANHISDKGLIHRLQKELLQLNNNDNKTPNNLIKNGQKNRHFSSEDIQITNKHNKRCSTSLIIREIENQNHNDILLYIHQDGHFQKKRKKKSLKMLRSWNPCAMSMEM